MTFTEIVGMEQLNKCEPRKISVKGPYTFSIGDTSGFDDYVSGGIFNQVKMPKTIPFVSEKLEAADTERCIRNRSETLFNRPNS